MVRSRDGRSDTVKTTSIAAATAATALLAGGMMAGCSVSTPAPAESVQSTASPEQTRDAAGSGPLATDGTSQGARAGGTREACELFNRLVADYSAVAPTDSKGYEDVYLKAQDAKDTVSGDLQGLFASLSLLAIDHSSAAEAGAKPAPESQDAVRDAVFANSAACTAAGVTLRL
ncbi:hypothetical protein FB478_10480 [Arthrobacter sp. AG367]|nr:hypothetical protein FB478_10480 [Arthrobacter sp. AG367]